MLYDGGMTAEVQSRLAVKDIDIGLRSYAIWMTLGWQDIRQRYRRSTLGPFWITLSLAMTVGGMGILYGKLFHQRLSEYFPYLTVGMVLWNFLSTVINESCVVFIHSEGIIKQVQLPFTLHVLRMVWRNIVVFLHNALVIVPVLVLFRTGWHWQMVLLPVALSLVVLNVLWFGLMMGMICARFRDVPQIVVSFVQILFFLTPVMWQANALGQKQWLAKYNPLYHVFEIVRGSVLGSDTIALSWIVVAGMCVLGFVGTFSLFKRYRHRIAYWV